MVGLDQSGGNVYSSFDGFVNRRCISKARTCS
jgi:hypothetical protein